MLAPLADALIRSVEDQLRRIMGEEGLTSRWERHARLRGMVERWVAERGDVSLIAVPGRRAATVSWLSCGAGAGRLRRLDHAGEMTLTECAGMLAAVDRELTRQ